MLKFKIPDSNSADFFICDHTIIFMFSRVTFYFPFVAFYVESEHLQLHAAWQTVWVKISGI